MSKGSMVVMSILDHWPPAGRLFTVDDLDRMPDEVPRYELSEGALIASPRPRVAYQDSHSNSRVS